MNSRPYRQPQHRRLQPAVIATSSRYGSAGITLGMARANECRSRSRCVSWTISHRRKVGAERDALPMNRRSQPKMVILLLFRYLYPTQTNQEGAQERMTGKTYKRLTISLQPHLECRRYQVNIVEQHTI